ncbi:MAG: hypothetical protein FJ045_06420, partial [Crenarchaeota archaeon]|nr:hypothetical protein [Thermoproteota archaeon]
MFDQRELYATANEILTPFKIDKEICDDSSYSSCIEALKARVAQQDKMEKKLRLEALRSRCENLEKALQDTTESGRNFLDLYEKLIEAKEKIKLLDLEQFLSKGKDLLDKGLAEPGKCPFCGSSVDLGNVKQEVEKRVKELESIRRESQSTKFLKDKWIGDLRNASRIAGELENEWAGLDVSEELKKLIQDATSAAMALAQDIEEKFVRYERISENEHWKETRKNLTAAICARAKKADAEIKALAFT